jgi:hypothetical protein
MTEAVRPQIADRKVNAPGLHGVPPGDDVGSRFRRY